MQTKEQTRSAFALEQIRTVFNDQVDEKTANFIVGTPTLILTNGLGQTLAFLLSKKKELKQKAVFDMIRKWLMKEIPALQGGAEMDFLKKFASLDQTTYLTCQQEALAMLQWLKRYARAFEKEV